MESGNAAGPALKLNARFVLRSESVDEVTIGFPSLAMDAANEI